MVDIFDLCFVFYCYFHRPFVNEFSTAAHHLTMCCSLTRLIFEWYLSQSGNIFWERECISLPFQTIKFYSIFIPCHSFCTSATFTLFLLPQIPAIVAKALLPVEKVMFDFLVLLQFVWWRCSHNAVIWKVTDHSSSDTEELMVYGVIFIFIMFIISQKCYQGTFDVRP